MFFNCHYSQILAKISESTKLSYSVRSKYFNSGKLWPDLAFTHLSYIDLSVKLLSHQWYDIPAALYNDKFLVFVGQSYIVVRNTPTLPYNFTGSRQACSFSLPFLDARLL